MTSKPRLLISIGLVAVTGCARLIGVPPSESKAAIEAKDYPKLKGMCTGDIRINSGIANYQDATCSAAISIAKEQEDTAFLHPLCGKRQQSFGQRYAAACPAMQEIAVAHHDSAALTYLCEHDKYDPACRTSAQATAFGDLSHPDCGQLRASFAEARKTFFASNKAEPEEMAPVVAALAKCGDGEMIFEQLAHIGQPGRAGFGARMLVATDKAGGPALFDAFQAYLSAHAGPALLAAEHGDFAADHIAAWLLATKRTDLCDRLVGAARGAKAKPVQGLMDYFVETDCKAAAPLVVPLLSSDDANVREAACETLGAIGGPKEMPKVEILADSDRTNRVVERPFNSGIFIKEFFVADACSKAIGKIKLRQ